MNSQFCCFSFRRLSRQLACGAFFAVLCVVDSAFAQQPGVITGLSGNLEEALDGAGGSNRVWGGAMEDRLEALRHLYNTSCCQYIQGDSEDRPSRGTCQVLSLGFTITVERAIECYSLCSSYVIPEQCPTAISPTLVTWLGDEDFFERQRASATLYNQLCTLLLDSSTKNAYWEKIEYNLEAAIKSELAGRNDLEIVNRLRKILSQLESFLLGEEKCPVAVPAKEVSAEDENTFVGAAALPEY